MPHSVPIAERHERSKMLHILSEKKRRAFYERNIGHEGTVIFENDVEGGRMHGFTENYIRVSAKYDPMLINECRNVVLNGISDKGLMEASEASPAVLTH